jgi:hypothetical protein
MDNQDVNYWDTNNYSPDGLDANKTYYWRIDEIGLVCTAKGNIWSFTIPLLPGQADNPTPVNGETNINIATDLSWSAGSYATSHDIYFGIENPPPFQTNQTGTTYDSGLMDVNTTYYWRIDEKNGSGTTTGILWNFTTGSTSEVNDANLVAWWKLDETTGATAYDSKGSNNGTVNGTATWTTGKIGGALSFNGSSN